MRTLPRTYLKLKEVSLKKIPLVGGVIIFAIFLLPSLSFLALPARASLESPTQIKGLDEKIVLNFPFPVKRDKVEIEIYPPVTFEYEWSGILVNQTLQISPTQLLFPDNTYTVVVRSIENPLGISGSDRTFSFKTESLPQVVDSYPKPEEGRVKPNPVFSFTLDKKVSYGSYELISSPSFQTRASSGGLTFTFTPNKPLAQNKKYSIGLQFNAEGLEPTKLLEGTFLVVKPLKIVKITPKTGIQNASKKGEVKIKFNKKLKPLFLGSYIKIKPLSKVQFELIDQNIVKITPKPQFATDTDYKIRIDQSIEAIDGAVLEKNFTYKFKTAGPVSILANSPSGWGISLSSMISVTFDQKVNRASAEEKFSFKPKVAGSFNWSGNTMTFVPNNVLDLFKQYNFSLAKGIESPGGEPSSKIFDFSFKTTSERNIRIGTSVKGRPITAYYFGTGKKKVLLVGSLHGSESNTASLLSSWVSFLRANQNQVPSDKTFIIVPSANPDGVAKGDRFNANGVDLNRNWSTPTWQKDTYWTYGKVKAGGGGKPFSEPETRALRDLINREDPKITISYHSAAGVVISAGISNPLRDWYSKKTGYTAVAGAPTPYEDKFSYDVTGSLEEWLKGKIVIVVELTTSYSSEYLRNLPALKGLLTYPL